MSAKSIAIIGAGPAGLMAAEVLANAGIMVTVYDAMPSAGRKFLMAGKGGMNITHAEPMPLFLSRYATKQAELSAALQTFSPEALRAWVHGLGISTFIGSSGRVFPVEMKAAPLLRAWLHRLRSAGVKFQMRHRWLGWTAHGELRFALADAEKQVAVDGTVLALGGGSWPQLGANAAWVPILLARKVPITALQPANCGFNLHWSRYFTDRFAGQPLKSICLSLNNTGSAILRQQGELMLTEYGLEGGLIYQFSAQLRDEIAAQGCARINLDLLPQLDVATVLTRLSTARGKNSLANHLRKCLSLDTVKFGLLREVLSAEQMQDIPLLAATLKALPLTLTATRPLAEAISTAGGVPFTALDHNLMLTASPGVFCAGEMLDWEAPTGGYLLTACLATGRAAGLGVLNWLENS